MGSRNRSPGWGRRTRLSRSSHQTYRHSLREEHPAARAPWPEPQWPGPDDEGAVVVEDEAGDEKGADSEQLPQ